jgi:hypothetical protein
MTVASVGSRVVDLRNHSYGTLRSALSRDECALFAARALDGVEADAPTERELTESDDVREARFSA